MRKTEFVFIGRPSVKNNGTRVINILIIRYHTFLFKTAMSLSKHEEKIVATKDETYPWSYMTQNFDDGPPNQDIVR